MGLNKALEPLADIRQATVTQERQTAPAGVEQVRGGQVAAHTIVGPHSDVGLGTRLSPPSHHRGPMTGGCIDSVMAQALTDDNNGVSAPLVNGPRDPFLVAIKHSREQHVVTARRGGVGQVAQNQGEKWVRMVRGDIVKQGNDHRDRASLARTQGPGHWIDEIAVLQGQILDPLTGLGGN